MRPPRASVLMPTFDQARFLPRALESVLAQDCDDWELVIVDDGSPDDTSATVKPYLRDACFTYERFPQNRGVGAALNRALELARGELIAYLPSDDVFYPEHLRTLADHLDAAPEATLAFSGVRHHYNRTSGEAIPGYPLQLVQVMHRRTSHRWTEREELVSDDLERLFWAKVASYGQRVGTGRVSCEWVDHPAQTHKVIQEPLGGINPYRVRFGVTHPLRFHTTVGNRIDEVEHYRRFRERPDTAPAPEGLKILLLGELAYNAERVLALEERGHQLYGLWMDEPYWYNTVGPLPFGHVTDLPRDGWRQAVADLQPDVIYALLNWQVVPFAHRVLTAVPEVPFVWHFKEGPFICIEKGTWPELVDLYRLSDGQVYCSPEMKAWFETCVPDLADRPAALVLDGDLPKRDWLGPERSPRLSDGDGELHTVVPGRPIGLHPPDVARLAEHGIHLHFYGDFAHGQWREWIETTKRLAGRHLHLYPQVDQGQWVRVFSQYDAGWLHYFQSENEGDVRRANWDDLNYPARLATLTLAGLPVLQRDNTGAVVATQSLVRERDLGLFFSDMTGLAEQLRDEARLHRIRESVWRQREAFTFDFHADRLVSFFHQVIDEHPRRPCR
ncbi:MAG: glycosyltransferase family 2 protein [Actinomycetota bacterium]|nr:glycosyltransferase family 2 protein [Actinomycetota bacterium]